MNFRSDNEAPVAPEIMDAIIHTNQGYAHAYGDDDVTTELKRAYSDLFETDVTIFPVTTGTSANALCLSQMTPPFGMTICHEQSHIYTDECGAVEFFTGARSLPVHGDDGKISLDLLKTRLSLMGYHGDHESKATALSISQSTELGTVYQLSEITELAHVTHGAGLKTHMDGARFANALVALGCSPADMSWRAGIDMLSFGASKNGALNAEAIIVFNKALAAELGRRRKRAGHLISKMRYVSVQLLAYVKQDLWIRLAQNANNSAKLLADGLRNIAGVKMIYPVEANEIFVRFPKNMAKALLDEGFEFHAWPGSNNIYRLVTSHATVIDDIKKLLHTARQVEPS